MRIFLLLAIGILFTACQTVKQQLPNSKGLRSALEIESCQSSKGPELVKNGNFEVTTDSNVWYWKNNGNILLEKLTDNHLIELSNMRSAQQLIKFRSPAYFVSFEVRPKTEKLGTIEVGLLGQRIVHKPNFAHNHRFQYVFHGNENHTLSIKSLSDETIVTFAPLFRILSTYVAIKSSAS